MARTEPWIQVPEFVCGYWVAVVRELICSFG